MKYELTHYRSGAHPAFDAISEGQADIAALFGEEIHPESQCALAQPPALSLPRLDLTGEAGA